LDPKAKPAMGTKS